MLRHFLTFKKVCPWLCAAALFTACGGLKEPTKIFIVVRERQGAVLSQRVSYQVLNKTGQAVLSSGQSNELGFFEIPSIKKTSFDSLIVKVSLNGQELPLRLNKYVGFYDLYLKPFKVVPDSQRTADFHYHVSMKPHNTFGQKFYSADQEEQKHKEKVPTTMSWLKLRNKLRVYYNGKWQPPYVKENISSKDNKARLKIFLEGKWVRSKDGANNFKNFTEATKPHTFEGNVYLAFNAISPFEHSVSNDGIKRVVSSILKTGASKDWLLTMGAKKNYLTHWKNFNHEYFMMMKQDTLFNNFRWSHLRKKQELLKKEDVPIVVNVVEGAHILQDKYFPHFVNYDLMDSTGRQKTELYDIIGRRAKMFNDKHVLTRLDIFQRNLKTKESSFSKDDYKAYAAGQRNKLVDSLLLAELYQNVDSLKKMDIHMMAISHLSYNGMTGHAPALDVSQKPAIERVISVIAQRAYGIRVSNDLRYRKAFDGLFFRVPGVNAFGDSVLNRLLDFSKGGRRIPIDLKHSDVITRRVILKKYEDLMKKGDTIPPICSHCAVNGLSVDYTSPLLNEYRLLHSSLARKFYPFSINLYNEEIKTICERNGMIGIPLEERVLGGYLNNKLDWPTSFEKINGRLKHVKKPEISTRRYDFTAKALSYLQQENDPDFIAVSNFYKQSLLSDNVFKDKIDDGALKQLICEEYLSAESFLQNLFHIVDIASTVKREMRRDTLLALINETFQPDIAKQKPVTREYIEQHTVSNDSLLAFIHDSKPDVAQLPDSLVEMTAGGGRKVMQEYMSTVVDSTLNSIPASAKTPPKENAWMNVCIGSDLDGLIDPINICPTASHYPHFREKLKIFIPLFLHIRKEFEVSDKLLGKYSGYDEYFDTRFTIDKALDLLFYKNLRSFTQNHFDQ